MKTADILISGLLKILLLAAIVNGCGDKATEPSPPADLLQRLNSLPGVTATEIDAPAESFHTRAFEIDITQPVDHSDPASPTFNQRVYLSHLNESAPTVLVTSGYFDWSNRVGEVCEIITANQISVSHRYMGTSRPDPMEWDYLNVAQAAADHHRIVEIFKQIYTGKWVSTGRSKGGQAALFHRRYYPEDVAVTIAMVAPIVFGVEDPRFDVFLTDVVSDEDCRAKIRRFQRRCLEKRDSLLPYLEHYADTNRFTYTITMDSALEYSVLEFPFAFFQAGSGDCADVPDSTAGCQEDFEALMRFSPFDMCSVELIEYYGPVYYQIYSEIGYYRLMDDHLTDLIEAMPDPTYSAFVPPGSSPVYHPEVVQDLAQWLSTEGDSIIYVYGAVDPWSASAIDLSGGVEALLIMESGANHSVYIGTLADPDPVYEKLEQWLRIDLTSAKQKPPVSRIAERALPDTDLP
jgi:hypothetical protein